MEIRKTVLLLCIVILSLYASESILIVRSQGKIFEKVVKGISYDCEGSFHIKELLLDESVTVKVLQEKIEREKPSIVVLLNNSAVLLYAEYQKGLPPEFPKIPSISSMSVFVDKLITKIDNAAAIAYEIPLATAYINLPPTVKSRIKRVGVVHREKLQEFVDMNQTLCQIEHIEIINKPIPESKRGYKMALYKAVKSLLSEEAVDALWIPNDSKLLQLELIQGVWLPLVNRYNIPVIAGVKVLAQPSIDLATFVVSPDHVEIGQHISELIFEAKEQGWKLKQKVYSPISVYKILNKKHFQKTMNIELENYYLFQEIVENDK